MSAAKTLVDKIWDQHVVDELGGGYQLMYIDRCFLHDLSGPISIRELQERGLVIANPELVYATPDHLISSKPNRQEVGLAAHAEYIPVLRHESKAQNFALFDVDDERQGIVHVIGPEQAITLPGLTVVCGDSHTSTHGGIGALAWGVGTSDQAHLLATKCIVERKPKTMRINFEGKLPPGIGAKDIILGLIAEKGSKLGVGYAIEFSGQIIRDMGIEARLTICNLSIELGARWGIIAPDEVTFDYLRGRPFAPKEEAFEQAVAHWRTLCTDKDARFDVDISFDVSNLQPQVSWGTNPAQTIGIHDAIPDPDQAPNDAAKNGILAALEYMGLAAGEPIEGTPINQVFIGSCTNGRLSDLKAAAAVVRGRRVADDIVAWVVPGSQLVKKAAEESGLDKIFTDAGFEWRESSCSLCSAANGEQVPPEWRCVSTSNRNYMGRQGPRSRTHLTNPEMAAAAAIAGRIISLENLDRLAPNVEL